MMSIKRDVGVDNGPEDSGTRQLSLKIVSTKTRQRHAVVFRPYTSAVLEKIQDSAISPSDAVREPTSNPDARSMVKPVKTNVMLVVDLFIVTG